MMRTILQSKPTAIALDLEHHDYRTYGGFLCLMQLSTREGDWVVDLCVPEIREVMDNTKCDGREGGREESGNEMAELLSDPELVKVLHGAESDVVWLQRDFGLYVVGLFDTFHASKVLGGSLFLCLFW